jgi:hypothetical protein
MTASNVLELSYTELEDELLSEDLSNDEAGEVAHALLKRWSGNSYLQPPRSLVVLVEDLTGKDAVFGRRPGD